MRFARIAARGLLSLSLGAAGLVPAIVRADDGISAQDAEQIVTMAEKDVNRAAQDLAAAKVEVGSASASPAVAIDRRIREGEIHFLLEDHLRAAVVLMDVVENPANRSHPRYDEADYYLATSLAKLGNYGESRKLYEDLLGRVSGPRLKDVVGGLLEVAHATRRYENVERYVARLREAGGLSGAEVDYIYGKTLFQSAGGDQMRLNNAYDAFKRVPNESPLAPQAAYYAGVVRVEQKQLAQSIPEFDLALTRTGKSESQYAVRDLANVALGRVYFELNQLDKSVEAYKRVGRGSKQFQDMLFELAWAHVKAAKALPDDAAKAVELAKALRMAELLMASGPDSKMAPEARILEGNLQIRVGSAEAAYESFQGLIDRYGGARTQLGELIAKNPDPRTFFDQLIGADLSRTSSTELLPPVAVDWALTMPEMRKAVSVLSDLKTGEMYAKDSREIIQTLELALGGEARFSLAGLGKARQRAHAAENRAVLTIKNLLDVEHRMASAIGNPNEVKTLQDARARRAPLEGTLQTLPSDTESAAGAGAAAVGQYREAEARVHRQFVDVASMRAQIAAVDVWIGTHRDALTKERVAALREKLVTARAEVKAMETDLDTMQSDLRVGADVASTEGGRAHGAATRAGYLIAIQSEAALLKQYRPRFPPEFAALLPRIDAQRNAAEAVVKAGDALDTQMEPLVEGKVAEMRKLVASEAAKLDAFDQAHGVLRAQTDATLGPVAAASLAAVAAEFNDLVLKADVGIIDVAWARKQGVTDKVSELVRQQSERTKELESQFSDVLEGN